MIGRRLPMLRTSTGRAYLSFCPQAERAIILKHLRRIDDPEDRPFLAERALNAMIEQTGARGYAIRDAGEYNPKTSSIAVPIHGPDHILGCFSVIWIRSALAVQDAIAQFLEPMQQAAALVGRGQA
jgi:IclR family mhp operon transcriptional activator